MDQKKFFLSSSDYVDSPAPRECVIVGECLVHETRERLIRVSISPPLPGDLVGSRNEVSSLLLGQIDTRLRLSDVGLHPFMVDIYFQRTTTASDDCTVSEIERIGCGLLHSTMEDAMAASPIGN